MKELDVLLERFVRRGLDRLAEGELEALERLLEQPDQDILEWITTTTVGPPPDLSAIAALVRSHALGQPRVRGSRITRMPRLRRCSPY